MRIQQDSPDQERSIEGTVAEIVFRNQENGYTVLTLNDNNDTTVVGTLPFLSPGELIRFNGRWTSHPDYGRQFTAEGYEYLTPQTEMAIEHYLSGGLISGVGPVLARRLVARFGLDTLQVLQNNPDLAAHVKGISRSKAVKIADQLREKKDFQDLVLFLYPLGIGTGKALRIFRKYGTESIQSISENPYRLADDIFGIGFLTADRLARQLGLNPKSVQRIKSGLRFVLTQAANQGHTYLPETVWIQQTEKLLQTEMDRPQLIEDCLAGDPTMKRIQIKPGDRRGVLTALLRSEKQSAMQLKILLRTPPLVYAQLCNLQQAADAVEDSSAKRNLTLSSEQRDGLILALRESVSILTGGPGTGKTTILRLLCDCMESQSARILLAAPTGRAARRLSESTGRPAQTLHRLLNLQYVPDNDPFMPYSACSDQPLEADLVIVDEASMIDVFLFDSLIQSIRPGCRLLLVGDADQLPSVGAGDVLRDLIDSGQVPTARLTRVYRQAEESLIIQNAHRINQGLWPQLDQTKDSSFLFIAKENAETIADAVARLIEKILPETYGLDPLQDVFVLTPTRKGSSGTHALNQRLQRSLLPPQANREGLTAHGCFFGLADRVMQTRNNYELVSRSGHDQETGVFNGEIGTVIAVDQASESLQVCFDDDRIVTYDRASLDDLELAYAMTVHKSQGSEYSVVILAVAPGPPQLLTRNLLYTAITRARDKLFLVAPKRVIEQMLANRSSLNRWTFLAELLQTDFGS
ncbi:MAG: ATP-dependent RecD-like DNA helicase [Clostridiaceae bacterium]|nr:ATP-dependent RecD-like DNA helicase [Clostridiaceae bacterium]